ncbi:hypothetical protein J3Q64DRAFT_1735335 [Phycomyces blakesleeanus]|uniref:Twinfilin n=2 Tax=Phycomyces blakesleeanus TaxID=4837 RepID=A0A162Q001_PHYB8|nr:hypothetical protein PHYBLDRAFT_186074 [Phycomyces blakesleeanus NRRL 1555(-)]OAD75916.1 hypothetical protein PHYBLDRAFT_186074 [Phycomyces blakesleeanus NRRL 1555(-)]|eukprot:XP_018293956.1 hypothetical protein PHYBLDRAFT_186074 [Phycomyces blakesleeanus NRRL 1555(-)]
MSHQSGIKVSEELAQTFSNAVSGGETRVIRISIIKESLEQTGTSPVEGSLEQDFVKVGKLLEDSQPSFILVRLDEKAPTGEHKWLFMSYVPDNAKVRDKMLYASTRATLIKELGDYRFTETMYGTQENEFTIDSFKKHIAHKAADKPLTRRERELAEVKAAEAKAVTDYQGTSTRKSYAAGVSFPLTEEAINALNNLAKPKEEREHNYVSLCLNNEKIDLDTESSVPVNKLKDQIPSNAPRFTFYAFEHEHAGETKEAIVFVYTCPPSSKIREKMLYSSSKSSVITGTDSETALKIAKKYETSDPSDVTSEYFLEDLYTPLASSSSGDSTQSGAGIGIVADRIQMLGSTQGGFKRPSAPGRRRPGAH